MPVVTTRAQEHLAVAATLGEYVWRRARNDSDCGPGLYWSSSRQYKNAITNELWLLAFAKLARLTDDTAASKLYAARATMLYDWFNKSGMRQASGRFAGLVLDGVESQDKGCAPRGLAFTYNQGVILGGLVELGHLDEAVSIADHALLGLTTTEGVLHEPVGNIETSQDSPQFKGIFVRYLRYLTDALETKAGYQDNVKRYRSFLRSNAVFACLHAAATIPGTDAVVYDAKWEGPFNHSSPTAQTSVLDLFTSCG